MKNLKKLLIVFFVLVSVALTGCKEEKKNTKVNKYENINIKLIEKIHNIKINDEIVLEGLDKVDGDTLETKIGINREYVEDHAIEIDFSSYNLKFFMVIKAKNDKKDKVKTAMYMYYNLAVSESSKENQEMFDKIIREEYKDYYVYIASPNTRKVYNKVKQYLK